MGSSDWNYSAVALTCQDWDYCLQGSETQELAKWIYDNLPTLDNEVPQSTAYDLYAAQNIYNFLNWKLLPELRRTLDLKQLDLRARRILTEAVSRINVQFEAFDSWINVCESLREHHQVQKFFDQIVTKLEENGFPNEFHIPPSPVSTNNGYVLASNAATNQNQDVVCPDSTTDDSMEEPMDQDIQIQMPSPVQNFNFNMATCGGYVTAMSSPVSMQVTKSTINEEMLAAALQPLSPVLKADSPASEFTPISLETLPSQIEAFHQKLNKWKETEQGKEMRVGPGIAQHNVNILDQLEKSATEIVRKILQLLPQEPSLKTVLEDFLKTLLVVTQQPERVIIYKTKFTSTLKILLKPELLAELGIVSVVLWNQEKQDALKNAKKASERKILTQEKKCCVLKGNRVELRISIPGNPTRMDRSDSLEGSTVLDEFFWLNFGIVVKIAGFVAKDKKPISVTMTATSFPIKVTVHANQSLKAWETVIWSNAGNQFDVFKISDRSKSLPFHKVCEAINVRFLHVTERILNGEDFQNVARILFGNNQFDYPNAMMNFQQDFRREVKLSDLSLELSSTPVSEQKQEISFWGWWCHLERFIMKHLLIRKNGTIISNLWKDGKVTGYTCSETINQILDRSPEGTFVLRFSSATPNGITVQFRSNTEGILSTRFTGKELTEKLNFQHSLDSASPWKTLHCPGGEKIPKKDIFKCDRIQALSGYAGSALSEQPASPRSGGLSQLPRYVFARIKLSWN